MNAMENINPFPPDPNEVSVVVSELMSLGMFDQFRKECSADVDTKPAFKNLKTRVEADVNHYLGKLQWKPSMNKNQMREALRKYINDATYLEGGIERIVDQVVNPKIGPVFLPKVKEVVNKHYGIEKPRPRDSKDVEDLLKDLESISSSESEAETNVNKSTEDKVNGTSPVEVKTEVKIEVKNEENGIKEEDLKDKIKETVVKMEVDPAPVQTTKPDEDPVANDLKDLFKEKIKGLFQLKNQLQEYSKQFKENSKDGEKEKAPEKVSEDKNKPIRRSRRRTNSTYKTKRDPDKSESPGRNSDSSSESKKQRDERRSTDRKKYRERKSSSKKRRTRSSERRSRKSTEKNSHSRESLSETVKDLNKLKSDSNKSLDDERVQIVTEDSSSDSSSFAEYTEVSKSPKEADEKVVPAPEKSPKSEVEEEGERVQIISEDSDNDTTESSNTNSQEFSLTKEETNKIIFG